MYECSFGKSLVSQLKLILSILCFACTLRLLNIHFENEQKKYIYSLLCVRPYMPYTELLYPFICVKTIIYIFCIFHWISTKLKTNKQKICYVFSYKWNKICSIITERFSEKQYSVNHVSGRQPLITFVSIFIDKILVLS